MCRPSALCQSERPGAGTEEGPDVMATENQKGEMQGCQDVATSSSITNFFCAGYKLQSKLKNDFHSDDHINILLFSNKVGKMTKWKKTYI